VYKKRKEGSKWKMGELFLEIGCSKGVNSYKELLEHMEEKHPYTLKFWRMILFAS
jgi:uncharacterized short protein YbdD (DUF466 family)